MHLEYKLGALVMAVMTFIIGYGGTMIPLLIEVLNELKNKYKYEYNIITPSKYSERNLELLKKSNVVLIYSQRLPDEVEEILNYIRGKAKIIGVDENHSSLSNIDSSTVMLASTLLRLGGKRNIESLVLLMLRVSGYKDIYVPEPIEIPWHGIYHPKLGVYNSVEEYLKNYPYSNRPLIGILFYRGDWLYNRTIIVDKLVEKLENSGLGVIPVFTYGFRIAGFNTPSREDSIRKFFLLDDKPIIDLVINLTSFFLLEHGSSDKWVLEGYRTVHGVELLKKLNVPVIQALISYSKSPSEWIRDPKGVDYMTMVYRIIMPEVDGVVEPIMVAGSVIGSYGEKKLVPIEHQLDYLVSRVKKWVNLKHKKPWERRIAIILINPPCKGLEANVAVGLGLDVPESIVRFLRKLKESGYNVGEEIPRNGEELVKLILTRKAISEFRWTSVEEIVEKGGTVGFVDEKTYLEWFNELPREVRDKMIREWGNPVDVLKGRVDKVLAGMVYNGKFVVPGIRFGNIVLIPQPKRGCAGPRCDGRVCKILHDPTVPPPHQWLAVYRWITRVFKADVVIHFGTHGYLEFLPGKSVGLSPSCWPQITLDDVPHLYVYVVSNPMEGVVAKRRSYAVLIDHMYPPMKHVDVLNDVEQLLSQYVHAVNMGDKARAEIIYKQLLDKARENNIPLPKDLDDRDKIIELVHRHIHMVKNTYVNMGLHILGQPPESPRRLAEYILVILSNDTPLSPSLRRVFSEYLGLDYDDLARNPLKFNTKYGLLNSQLLRKLDELIVCSLEAILAENEYIDENIVAKVNNFASKIFGKAFINHERVHDLVKAVKRALDVANRIRLARLELDSLLKATSSSYVEPGPSGPLTRGKIEVLPTGRNFYLVDPRSLPTKAAWIIGKESAEKLVKYYLEKYGRYPETIGQVLWSIDAYKADGEQLAQILYLLGVEPVWDENGVVRDLRVIPLEELGRPRIDVVVRISGIVRDTLPNYIELIDKAVAKVIQLPEPPDKNYVRKHYFEALSKLKDLGLKDDEADRKAKFRVYGPPPGAYGAGVNLAVEASAWKTQMDLAKVWIQWSGYAYTSTKHGEPAHDSLLVHLEKVDMVNRNHVSDEHDVLGCCCYFAYHGGFYNTVKSLTGRGNVEVVTVDTRNTSLIEVRDMKLEIERTVRARLLNKEWVEEMKKHGYRGANEIQRKILHLYGWASTARNVDDWVFNEIARRYVLDDNMRKWFLKHNKWALEEITRRLIEAALRGIWNPPRELLEKLRELYNEIEGAMEEEVYSSSDIQGGGISIVTAEEVNSWSKQLGKIDELIAELTSSRRRLGSNK